MYLYSKLETTSVVVSGEAATAANRPASITLIDRSQPN